MVIIFITRARDYWKLTFTTLVGTAVIAGNFRMASTFADMAALNNAHSNQSGQLYRLAMWIVCPLILFYGTHRLLKLRAKKSIEALKAED